MPLCSARGRAATIAPNSDIDIMIDVDPDAHMSVYDYVGLKEYIAGLFEGPVDVVDRDGRNLMSVPPRRLMLSMPSDSPVTPLRDILYHIDLAQTFAAGFDGAAFRSDLPTVLAATSRLEIISEASPAY